MERIERPFGGAGAARDQSSSGRTASQGRERPSRGLVVPEYTRYSRGVDRDELLRALRAFESESLEYVLIGATAMGIHGLVRATEDVDLFIQATPENIERLRRAFRRVYPDDPHIEEIRANDLLGDYPAIRYYPPTGDLFFDVMTSLGQAASFDTVEAEIKEIEGIRVRVTPEALYNLKKDTVRPLDRQDAAALRERFKLKGDD